MDIAKFNKELSYKVAKANGLEKNNKLKEAIIIWVEISEMALKMSKSPNLDFSYRSMLMEKTEQIITHIKDLKLRLSGRKEIKPSLKTTISSKREYIDEEEEISKVESFTPKNSLTKLNDKGKEGNIIETSDIKNLPIGFKEIKASQDFNIITPHDENYVKEMLNKEVDMNIFSYNKPKEKPSSRIEFESPEDKSKMICFACGTEIPSNSLKCPTCGAELAK
ncbi:MAG: hypothetical protein ACFFKA_08220 [Candidatus Thorarchaeota archaeon]